ncbi:unnamed protein product [Trichogramma brassicae]|uniref:Uncharacterized protein n=1 Tax=Trichogramma brassicae TaxID=86971 RepID=A0A6H5IGG9_9HYME|nr:unnamed protein product [Trichogramma brassicae]
MWFITFISSERRPSTRKNGPRPTSRTNRRINRFATSTLGFRYDVRRNKIKIIASNRTTIEIFCPNMCSRSTRWNDSSCTTGSARPPSVPTAPSTCTRSRGREAPGKRRSSGRSPRPKQVICAKRLKKKF